MLMASAKQLQFLSNIPGFPPTLQNLLNALKAMSNNTNIDQIMENPAVFTALMQLGSNETQQNIKSEFAIFSNLKGLREDWNRYAHCSMSVKNKF